MGFLPMRTREGNVIPLENRVRERKRDVLDALAHAWAAPKWDEVLV